MAEWKLEFPAPAPWLNANSRTDRRAQTGTRRLWRDAAHIWAKRAKLPKNLDRVHIIATCSFPDKRRRDIGNYAPTLKAVVDGLVDAQLIPDDDDVHLLGPDLRRGGPSTRAFGWLALEIRAA